MKRLILYFGLIIGLLIFIGFINEVPVKASGLSSMSITGTGILDNASGVNSPITPTINFTIVNAFLSTDTITITLNGVETSATVNSTDVTFGGTCTGSVVMASVSHPTSNPSFVISNIDCPIGAVSVSIGASLLTTSSSGGNYSIDILTPLDSGHFLLYIGNTNQIRFTGTISPTLSFVIRNFDDTAEQSTIGGLKTCSFGVLTTTTVATCAYRLKIATNAVNGYTVSYKSDTEFSNGLHDFNNAAIGGVGTVITSGTENYGAVLDPGTVTSGGTVSRNLANFGSNAANSYKITGLLGPYDIYSSDGMNAPSSTDTVNTALMTHKVAISASSPTGNYLHTVVYTVSAIY